MDLDASAPEAKLVSLYQRIKKCLEMQFSDDENLLTLRSLPLCQLYIQNQTRFTEDEMFAIIFRFNKQLLSRHEESISTFQRKLNEDELILLARMVLSGFRMHYTELGHKVAHLCGDHNQPDLSFFASHPEQFVVMPPLKKCHNIVSDQAEGDACGEEKEEEDVEDKEEKGDMPSPLNPWIMLRQSVR